MRNMNQESGARTLSINSIKERKDTMNLYTGFSPYIYDAFLRLF